nr:reverse transcriptase domain, reverse transcriptase zinc-binding domain protein [Tanacetum cinerariifolium]GEY92281.1 reverse transcriptase domain, reverse transcriptase zinc-binding domain protein [Tanacetum cinerariifolium]
MRLYDGWQGIIDRFRDGLSLWKAKTLSVCGRLTLIKSVLGSLPVYYLSLFKAPLSVLKVLDSIRCRFFWGHKEGEKGINWVKWKSILLGSNQGGLGVGCLQSKNLSLLGKWKWRFLTDKKALWHDVIKEFYGEDGGFATGRSIDELNNLSSSLNNLSNESWFGSWAWRIPPRLFALESIKGQELE